MGRNFLARHRVSRFNLRRMKKQKAYAAAGVDIDLGNKVKATLPQLLASTHLPANVHCTTCLTRSASVPIAIFSFS